MKGINKAILVGSVGRDPEIRYTPSGTAVATFSMATNVKFKDKHTGENREAVNWHNCVGFGKPGELIGELVRKGSKLYVEGSIDYQEYEKDGIKRTITKIAVKDFILLGGPSGGHKGHHQQHDNDGDKDSEHQSADSLDDIPF